MDSNNISASSKTSGAKLATNLVGKFRNSFSGKKRPVSSSKPMEHSPSFNSESTGAPTDNLYFQPSPLLFNNKEEEEKREDDLPDFALHPLWGDRSPLLTTKYRASTGSFSSSPLVLGTSAAPQPPRERRSSKTSSVLHRMVRRASSSSTSKRPPPPELVGLIGKLRQRLQEFETPLQMTELDLERLLDDNGFGLELAVQDFVERAQLRQYKPGSTLTRVMGDSPGLVNAWSSCDASVFKLRCGPRYRELKLKKPSGKETLYEVIAVDMFAGVPLKEEHLSRYLNLTELERENNNSHPLPNLFIGNFMLPLNEPKMFGSVDNGPTVHFHLVMRLSAWAKANPDHYAVKLAAKLLGGGDSDQQQIAMKERLKIIVQVANPNELQLGKMERGLCNKYNSLPFLYRAYNSRYHRGYPV
ncbi:hypothetical protein BASA81_005441 [Batrachochytrium salamandrivorans]|nr:hypothetical protein BASA81_005441 [Batrachochytrium salamandrivorans]